MKNNSTTTTRKDSACRKTAVVNKGDGHDDDLLMAIAKARAKEGSISTAGADNATRTCCTGDDGSTTMTLQEKNIAVHAESKMARGSDLPHENCTSSFIKSQETDPEINSPTEEEFNILDVIRERQQTTNSGSPDMRYKKEIEKQKKKKASKIVTSNSNSNTNPTNEVGGGAEVLDDGIQMKKTDNDQANHKLDEEFDVMDAVLKRAALINNEESNGSAAVPEPPQSIERQRPINPVVSQPGAYSGAPGEGLQRRDTFRFSLVGALGALGWSRTVLEDRTTAEEDIGVTERTNDHNEPIFTNTDQIAGLAEATPVNDDDFIAPDVEAQPFDADEAEKRKSTSERNYRAKLALVAILIMAAVATVVGLVLKNRMKDEHHSVLPPSVAPSDAPSEIPSSAPTASLDLLRGFLSEKTVANLDTYGTPQQKAWDWLLNHPNITSLQEWRKTQLFALATFYYSFEGENWNKLIRERWMDYKKDECLWFSSGLGYFDDSGVYVDQVDGFLSDEPCNDAGDFVSLHVENLQLSGLVPTIPPEVALLTSLSVLSLAGNGINASFSDMMIPELFQLTNMTQLVFGENTLHGTIPSELVLMSGMDVLALWDNALTGPIPTELALLGNMTFLALGRNALTGTIPSVLGSLSNMDYLSLWDNALTGHIPSVLGLLTNMRMLYLFHNALTGTIPSVLGLLTNLVDLGLYSNSLTSQLPTELGLMTNMGLLYLWGNQLTGAIPTMMGLLSDMTGLSLQSNALNGPIPTELGSMTNMEWLYLRSNTLTGGIPTQLGMMPNLEALNLRSNFLTGTIHNSIWSLKNMTKLYLHTNNLSGSISTELGLMTNLLDLSLQFNSFSATIPSEVGLLTNLQKVWFHNNSLTGPVPPELELLAVNGSLGLLTLETNDFSGIVPEGLCSLGPYNDTLGSGLSFDCAEQLCGCDWCMCGNSSSSSPSGTQEDNGT